MKHTGELPRTTNWRHKPIGLRRMEAEYVHAL